MTETELTNRLERLERDNRRLKGLGVAALVLAAALGAVYAARPVPEKITAREFDVADASGNVRIRLSVSKLGEAGVTILDRTGVARAAMTLTPLGPLIGLGLHKLHGCRELPSARWRGVSPSKTHRSGLRSCWAATRQPQAWAWAFRLRANQASSSPALRPVTGPECPSRPVAPPPWSFPTLKATVWIWEA